MPTDKIFEVMRTAALSTNPKDIGIKNLPQNKIAVFGVVMDIGYQEGAATLITYNTGDASLYYSFGGGFTNGASRPEIKDATIKFVAFAQTLVSRAQPVMLQQTPLANINEINFYLLLNKGAFLLKTNINNIGSLSEFFQKANAVITKINVHSEVKLKHKYFGGQQTARNK
ncbi:hypothetical protein [Endomicrobium proavitum]|uniref:Uncharacterized protein n=1 Tax=Endomicrobium proavitum TaxID=1408281 RepID=A0A0G3WKV7_9BACT|nr:hypothetical protein [Endomicrobium proavitum]AKL98482.1 hypothetical protein Epro_1103 [Endomicrobium proavitum]